MDSLLSMGIENGTRGPGPRGGSGATGAVEEWRNSKGHHCEASARKALPAARFCGSVEKPGEVRLRLAQPDRRMRRRQPLLRTVWICQPSRPPARLVRT